MLAGQELAFVDYILVSLSGMAIVMLELILIACMILIMAKVVQSFSGKEQAAAPQAAAAAGSLEDEIQAVIMATISEDLQIPLEELSFKKIQSLQ